MLLRLLKTQLSSLWSKQNHRICIQEQSNNLHLILSYICISILKFRKTPFSTLAPILNVNIYKCKLTVMGLNQYWRFLHHYPCKLLLNNHNNHLGYWPSGDTYLIVSFSCPPKQQIFHLWKKVLINYFICLQRILVKWKQHAYAPGLSAQPA